MLDVQAVMESTAPAPRHVMVRQDGRVPVHYAGPDGVACKRTAVNVSTSDPRLVTCGQCQRRPAWKQAWHAEAKRATAP